jgi:hypothetical protein
MDIHQDNLHSELLKIASVVEVPGYVANAEVVTKEASDANKDALFADEYNRRYSIASPEDTWMSAAYFAKTAEFDGYSASQYEFIENRIKTAADVYGIRSDVDAVFEAFKRPSSADMLEVIEKEAEDNDSNYGYAELRMYPMFDEQGVKMANAYFTQYCFNYPGNMRRTIAKNIMRKSAEYGVDVDDRVRKEAGVGMPNLDFMVEQLCDRVYRAPNAEAGAPLLKAAELISEMGIEALGKNFEKFAELVESFDEAFGINKEYGKKYLAPSDFIFDVSIKEAEDFLSDKVSLGKYTFSLEKLAELPLEVYTAALGEDFSDRIKTAEATVDKEKLGDELYSLPIPDKNALVDAIKNYTI